MNIIMQSIEEFVFICFLFEVDVHVSCSCFKQKALDFCFTICLWVCLFFLYSNQLLGICLINMSYFFHFINPPNEIYFGYY